MDGRHLLPSETECFFFTPLVDTRAPDSRIDPLDAKITRTIDGQSETYPIRTLIAMQEASIAELEQLKAKTDAEVERAIQGEAAAMLRATTTEGELERLRGLLHDVWPMLMSYATCPECLALPKTGATIDAVSVEIAATGEANV